MPPKPSAANKRKAVNAPGDDPAAKKREANEERRDENDEEGDAASQNSTADQPEGILGLPQELLDLIFYPLYAADRLSLSLTCRRLYAAQAAAPKADFPRNWAHLAIRQSIEPPSLVGPQRLSRRRANSMPSKLFVEFELMNGGICIAHENEPVCKLVTYRRGWPIRFLPSKIPFANRDKDALYWSVPLSEAVSFLNAIALTTRVDQVCAQLDFASPDVNSLREKLRELKCKSLKLQNVKPMSDIDRKSGVKNVEVVANLRPSFFATDPAFFPDVKKLILQGIRMEEEEYSEFYEWIKGSNLESVCLQFDLVKNAKPEFADFAHHAMGLRKRSVIDITTCLQNVQMSYKQRVQHLPFGLKMVDGRWGVEVTGSEGSCGSFRLSIEKDAQGRAGNVRARHNRDHVVPYARDTD